MPWAIACWCVLIVALLPYIWTSIARSAAGVPYDHRNPRAWQDRQTKPRSQRAHAAQRNGFESFPLLAAAVPMAQMAGVGATTVATLALLVTAARIAHGLACIAGHARLRGVIWLAGLPGTLALMVLAALHVG